MAAALTAWTASAQLYVTGGNVTNAPASWAPENPLVVTAVDGEYTFEANGGFKMSTVKGDWPAFNAAALGLDSGWTTENGIATSTLKITDIDIAPAETGIAITYKVKEDFSQISAILPSGPVEHYFYVTGGFNGWNGINTEYRMTQIGENTYSYTAISGLPLGNAAEGAGFKITRDGSDWYGCFENVKLNKKINAFTGGDAHNFEIEVPAGAEIIFTYVEGGQSTVLIKAEGVEPTVNIPEHLYITGNIKDNIWLPESAPEMAKDGNVFSISNVELVNEGFFSFLTSRSWNGIRYGAPLSTGGDLSFRNNNATFTLTENNNDIGAIHAGEGIYDFTVTFEDNGDVILNVKRHTTWSIPEHLYIVGSIGSDSNYWWNPNTAPELTKDGNTFSISNVELCDVANFSFLTTRENAWYNLRYGAPADNANLSFADGTATLTLVTNVGDVNAINATPGTFNITVVFTDDEEVILTITTNDATSAIDAIEAAATAAPAEYYNLQGIRILTPEAGQLYIVNRAGKVSKEIAR